MMDLAIFVLIFAFGSYFCSIELHRRFMGTWVENFFARSGDGEIFRMFCFSLGCKLALIAILIPFALVWVLP